MILMVNTAMAYTVLFRDGHRLEVPTVFIVSTSTLTCTWYSVEITSGFHGATSNTRQSTKLKAPKYNF